MNTRPPISSDHDPAVAATNSARVVVAEGAPVPLLAGGPGGRVGVTAGKFNPPHLGHQHLIEQAAADVDLLVVLLCDRPDQTIPAKDRARWLQASVPDNVVVTITPDDLPDDASDLWARRTISHLAALGLDHPDVAYTSEAYGKTWAEQMGCEHVEVDMNRITVPVCATDLRDDLAANFPMLIEPARLDLARRIVLIGAESTGKSTLAAQLAERLQTVWAPEYGRTYWEGRAHRDDQSWNEDEFTHIARMQTAMVDQYATVSPDGLVIADTDALATAAWARRYLGHVPADVTRIHSTQRPITLYLLCEPDIDWMQDGTRESQEHRTSMTADMASLADASGTPTVRIAGHGTERLDAALSAIEKHATTPTYI